MKTIPFIFIDSLTDQAFGGNPTPVLFLEGEADSTWMQKVATEMNYAESVFVYQQDGHFPLRWFTPTAEVDLCGHGTHAAAFALWDSNRFSKKEPIQFKTRSGPITAKYSQADGTVLVDFPADPPKPIAPPENMLDWLGLTLEQQKQVQFIGRGLFDYLVVVPDETTLRSLEFNHQKLKSIQTRGFVVTAPADRPGFDYALRQTAPAYGVLENPSCGSAHLMAGVYWFKKLGKQEVVGYPATTHESWAACTMNGERILMRSRNVTVLRGEWLAVA